MGYTRQEVIENELIDMDVLDEIPEKCECGAPIMFTNTVRQIYCSNPRCYFKVATRLEKMAKIMQVDGFGESTCIDLCRYYSMISPFQVMLLKGRNDLERTGIAGIINKVADITDEKKRKIKLWEVVKYAGIPNIEQTAYKIFSGYNSMEEAYENIEKGQVAFVADKLGIKRTESAVMASEIYKNLIEYKAELFFGQSVFNVQKEVGLKIEIAITGGVYGYKNKGEFINYINKRYIGKVNAMLATSVSSSIDVLIADGDTGSIKFRNASRINEKYLSNAISKGEITDKSKIGTFENDTDLHPIGESIFICTHTELIDRLDKIFSNNQDI